MRLFSTIWEWIVSALDKVTRRQLYFLILGLLVAAFFAIAAHMTACVVPVLLTAFVIEFVLLWNARTLTLADAVPIILGGLLINIFTIL